MIVAASRVVTSETVYEPGWVEISGGEGAGAGVAGTRVAGPGDARGGAAGVGAAASGRAAAGRILAVGAGRPARVDRDLSGATLVPGFVDLHVHGGGGGSYAGADRESALCARAAHLAHGTTATMASLVTDSPEALLRSVRMLAELVAEGRVRGIHLEGPWLSPARAGAHDPQWLRDPDPAEIDELIEAGSGALSMVTIAPELPGAIAAIERFVAAGVVVAIGHTDADHATTRRAIDAGASVATHLFNAMRPLHHREPGPALALLDSPGVTVELIADGVHLHPALVEWAGRSAGSERVALVTDAMGAAGCEDGAYRLGPLDVEVSGGVARLSGTETIAGGTATMDAMFASALRLGSGVGADAGAGAGTGTGADADAGAGTGVGGGATTVGRPAAVEHVSDEALRAAVRMTATTPARALGWDDVGDIGVGKRADLVVLDAGLRVAGVILGGVFAE